MLVLASSLGSFGFSEAWPQPAQTAYLFVWLNEFKKKVNYHVKRTSQLYLSAISIIRETLA